MEGSFLMKLADIMRRSRITALTSYDYTMARLCDEAGIDILLVGDSAGMVMLGHQDTTQVTMEQMRLWTQAVSAAKRNAAVLADLPFMSYQSSSKDAVENSGILVKAGADAVKLEGGAEAAERISAIADAGIPVIGHIGVQPQTAGLAKGYKTRGKDAKSARKLVQDAKAVQDAGASGIVLEMVAQETAAAITEMLSIPTIGIGSGPGCTGQVLVLHDMLGMYEREFSFVKKYRNLAKEIKDAVREYADDVRESRFPELRNSSITEECREYLEQIGRRDSFICGTPFLIIKNAVMEEAEHLLEEKMKVSEKTMMRTAEEIRKALQDLRNKR